MPPYQPIDSLHLACLLASEHLYELSCFDAGPHIVYHVYLLPKLLKSANEVLLFFRRTDAASEDTCKVKYAIQAECTYLVLVELARVIDIEGFVSC